MKITYKVLFLSLFYLFFTSFSLIAQERAVAIVYDNSGSMKGEQCDAVNYALQTMVGVLSPDDELYVVTMEDKRLHTINLRNKQAEINNKIRPLQCRRDNPFEAVNIAIAQLDKSRKKQKYLLLLADGEWEDLDPKRPKRRAVENKKTLEDFSKQLTTEIIFLNLDKLNDDIRNTLKTVLSDINRQEPLQTNGKPKEIIRHMGDMAATVMSMSPEGLGVEQKGNRIVVNSKVPLKRLIVVGQGAVDLSELSNVTSVVSANKELYVEGPFTANKKSQNFSLSGKILHIKSGKNSKKAIPKGDINIKLNQPINIQQYKFLPETAAKLSIDFDGFFKTAAKDVVCDSTKFITLNAQILDLEGKSLDTEVLKESTVTFKNEDSRKRERFQLIADKQQFSYRLPVNKDRISFSVTAKHPNYFNYKSIVYTVKRDTCPLPKGIIEASKTDLTAKVTELDQAGGLTLTPKIKVGNAPPRLPTASELADLDIELEDNGAGLGLNIERKDGQITVTPTSACFCTLFTKTGQQQLKAKLVSKQNKIDVSGNPPLTININIEDAPFLQRYGFCLLLLFLILFILWYLLGIIKKKRFASGSEIIITKVSSRIKHKPRSHPLPTSFVKRWLIPYITETQMIGSVTFKAGSRDSHVFLAAETQSDNMYISGLPIDEPNKKDIRISNGESLEIVRRNNKEMYTYRNLE